MCACSQEDYICDVGYVRNDKGQCILTNLAQVPSQCEDGYMEVTQGYRKLPGNVCSGGVNLDRIRVRCGDHGAYSKWALLVVLGTLLAYLLN